MHVGGLGQVYLKVLFFREAGLQGEKEVSDMYLTDVITSQTSTSFSVKQDTNQSVT